MNQIAGKHTYIFQIHINLHHGNKYSCLLHNYLSRATKSHTDTNTDKSHTISGLAVRITNY